MHFLANVPAKLKEIIDNWNTRLSSARAAKIDNLDATVSSRAPASTALSNTVWTDARAANLDLLGTPAKINDVGFVTQTSYAFNPDLSALHFPFSINTASWQVLYSRSGSGAVTYLCGKCGVEPSSSLSLRLIIDGVEIWSASYTNSSGNEATPLFFTPVGALELTGGTFAKTTGGVPLIKYSSSVSLEYTGNPYQSDAYYKELWY